MVSVFAYHDGTARLLHFVFSRTKLPRCPFLRNADPPLRDERYDCSVTRECIRLSKSEKMYAYLNISIGEKRVTRRWEQSARNNSKWTRGKRDWRARGATCIHARNPNASFSGWQSMKHAEPKRRIAETRDIGKYILEYHRITYGPADRWIENTDKFIAFNFLRQWLLF